MKAISNILSLILFILLISALYTGTIVPFYRSFNFGKRVTYVKDIENNLKNKLVKIVGYIFLAAAIVYFINGAFVSYSTTKNDLISAPLNYETVLLPFARSLFNITLTIIVIGSIPRSKRESIYECGIKTNSSFVKWNEIYEIKTDDENRLLIYYKLKTLFFIKSNDCYIIEDSSNEIMNLIYDYWNRENNNIELN